MEGMGGGEEADKGGGELLDGHFGTRPVHAIHGASRLCSAKPTEEICHWKFGHGQVLDGSGQ